MTDQVHVVLFLAASDAVGTLGESTPLPWHAPPRLCGEPIAGARRQSWDPCATGEDCFITPIRHSHTAALGASWSPERFKSRVRQCTQDAPDWHRAVEGAA